VGKVSPDKKVCLFEQVGKKKWSLKRARGKGVRGVKKPSEARFLTKPAIWGRWEMSSITKEEGRVPRTCLEVPRVSWEVL